MQNYPKNDPRFIPSDTKEFIQCENGEVVSRESIPTMTKERYHYMMTSDECILTEEEWKAGWHFCNEFDGLLVGPGMGELKACKCLDPGHPVYKTIPADLKDIVGIEVV